jgi:hypothetical protein
MKEILQYLQNLYPGFANYFAAVIASLGVLSVLWKLGTKLWTLHQQKRLQNDLHPFYSAMEIQRATQYYVETKCQNIVPFREDEPRQTHAFATKEPIIPFFLKKAFKSEKNPFQFYIVLADSGMGKTTFLINLYLRYIEQFFGAHYQIKLFPLGWPEIDKEIEKIPDEQKRQTILLLDAFDEDMQAVHDYKIRLHDLIQKVVHFREVVITCRTQFFPSEEEEPKEAGVLQFGGEGGYREFRKLYLSPFDDYDVRAYLQKRFFWQVFKRHKARQIVASCPNLMVRPMLLSYIEDLLQSESPYTASYMVYAAMIQKWIEREARKVPPERRDPYKEGLWRFSWEMAVDIFHRRAERKGSLLIPDTALTPFAAKHGIDLHDIEMKSRSLLNRNARSEYKFSHKSILEYFLAEEALLNEPFRKEIQNFEGMDQAQAFFQDMIWDKLTVPFFNRNDLQGEYCLSDGCPKALTTIKTTLLPNVTMLKLTAWDSADDLFLFKGLPALKRVDISALRLTANQIEDLKHLLPNCRIQTARVLLRREPKTVSQREFRKEYIQHEYEEQGDVVVDHATGLM